MTLTTRLDHETPTLRGTPKRRAIAALIALSVFGSPLTLAAQTNDASASFARASDTSAVPARELVPEATPAVAALPALPTESAPRAEMAALSETRPNAEPPMSARPERLPSAAEERRTVKWEFRRLEPVKRPSRAMPTEPARDEFTPDEPTLSERWMLSVEGVTHAPIDVGLQAGIETPFGLRLFGGYGWMPEQYLGFLRQAASLASSDTTTRAIFESGIDTGSTFRAQIGIRPFSRVGVYLDAGYSQLRLDGLIEPAEINELALPAVDGGYAASTTLKMWLVELGYQAMIVDRIVIGAGIGVMGTLDSETELLAVDSGAESPALDEAAGMADELLETYGILPTLTLRLGLDLI